MSQRQTQLPPTPPIPTGSVPTEVKRKRHPVIAALILIPLLIVGSLAAGIGVFQATKKCVDTAELDRLVSIDNQIRRDFLNDLGNVPIGAVEAYNQQVLSPDLVNRAANAHAMAGLFSDYPDIADRFLSAEKHFESAADLILLGNVEKMGDEVLAGHNDLRRGVLEANDEARAC